MLRVVSARLRRSALVLAAAGVVAAGVAPAHGTDLPDEATISFVERTKAGLQILVSVPADTTIGLDGVTVTVDGQDAESSASLAKTTTDVRRTAVLAIDTSNSMAGPRFEAAKVAATTFLKTVPDDVYVGIVTFDSDVETPLEPSQDRAAAQSVIDGLELAKETFLYDGVLAATELTGDEGQRAVLVLSDGGDTSDTALEDVTTAIGDSAVLVDVVAIAQKGKALRALESMAEAGGGAVISADPEALRQAFAEQADALARQVLVTAQVPASVVATEATVRVTLPTGAQNLVAEAFTTIADTGTPVAEQVFERADAITLPPWAMYAAVGMVGVGLLVLFMSLVPRPAAPLTAETVVSRYAASGGGSRKAAAPERDPALTQAKDAAATMLLHNQGLEGRIARRLEAAGSELKAPEWLLLHMAIVVGAGIVGILIGKGSLIIGFIFLLVGLVVPWLWLGFKKSRRMKAFNNGLPDTLQLMAGSLQAGLSLAQSVDTIVREGTEPIAGEFKRVLVETRLGVPLEDALDGITERFHSKDFGWVVMAIKIQRDVGGNLAELLNTVAATIRERQYIRRQVAALAAEGKLSAYVLSGLPVLFLIYLVLTKRDYVWPMFTEPIGWVMLGGAALLLSVGSFWMSRLIKIEV